MRYVLAWALYFLLVHAASAQPQNVNPAPGYVWQFYGPTLGAGFGPLPAINVFPTPLGFYRGQGNGANIWRTSDRLFVGEAANYNAGQFTTGGGGNTWIATPGTGPDYVARAGTFLSSTMPQAPGLGGVIAISALTKSSDAANTTSIGVASAAVNDKASAASWGFIAEIQKNPGAGVTTGLEVAGKNASASNSTMTPYITTSGVFGLWLAGGGDNSFGPLSTFPSDAAMVVRKNTQSWNTGIVFDKTSITGTDGVSGTGNAIVMARGHQIRWLSAAGIGADIRSNVDAVNSNEALIFANGAIQFFDPQAVRFFQARWAPSGTGTNFIDVLSADAGSPPVVSAQGGDTNIDLKLSGKGTGVIQWNVTSNVATVPANFVAQRWIKFKDSSGTSYYLPLMTTTW